MGPHSRRRPHLVVMEAEASGPNVLVVVGWRLREGP